MSANSCVRSIDPTLLERIQSSNWDGSIPVQLSLASSSVSSPTLPNPIFKLVSRHSFLHISLYSSIIRLHKFSPVELSFDSGHHEDEPTALLQSQFDNGEIENKISVVSDKICIDDDFSCPVCWFEDDETRTPLRWQLFAGVLFDIVLRNREKSNSRTPWKINLHFNNYPINQILPIESKQLMTQVRHYFKNSLKQSLTLENGNSKSALNLTKESQSLLWESVRTCNYELYKQLDCCDFYRKTLENVSRIPIKIYLDAKAPMQPSFRGSDGRLSLGIFLSNVLPQYFEQQQVQNDLPDGNENDTSDVVYQPKDSAVRWIINGIEPSLNTSILDLWIYVCHPDQFLYIIVKTR